MQKLSKVPAYIFFLLALFSSAGTSWAAEDGAHMLSPDAPILFSIPLPGGYELPFSNSMVTLFIVICLLAFVVRICTLKMSLIPSRLQNFLEAVYEGLFGFFSKIMGEKMAQKTFWYISTSFILILVSNWLGLIPGVGIITYTNEAGVASPIFRGANADLNVTLTMGFIFAILWLYWAVREIGWGGLFKDIFAPKGTFKGLMLIMLIPIFLFVGVIDLISIGLRPITLGARLFGNVYAGEQIIETMSQATQDMPLNFLYSWMPVIPFYFMELLIGLLQALVFTLLAAVFIKMVCVHDDASGHEH